MTNIHDRGRSALQAWQFMPSCIVGGIYILYIYNPGEYFCKEHTGMSRWYVLASTQFPILLEGGRGLVTVISTHSVYVCMSQG